MNGEEWAKYDSSKFPIKTYQEIKLGNNDLKANSDELLKSEVVDSEWINKQLSKVYSASYFTISEGTRSKISERYLFSRYLLDPNRFRLRKVVRIVALVMLFVQNLKTRIRESTILQNSPKLYYPLNSNS